jgi:hypothetical protein
MQKYLVAYLDLVGFNNFHAFLRQPLTDQELRDYNIKLHDEYQDLMQNLQRNFAKVLDINILPASSPLYASYKKIIEKIEYTYISDSIVISCQCDDMELQNLMGVFAIGIANFNNYFLQSYEENKKKGYLLHFLPLRGGIAYEYGHVSFKETPPIAFGSAWMKSVELEKLAAWPRVILSPSLLDIIKSWSPSPTYSFYLNKSFDAQFCFIDTFTPFIEGFAEKKEFIHIECLFLQHQNLLKFWLESSAKWLALSSADVVQASDIFEKKFSSWIAHYNDRRNFLKTCPEAAHLFPKIKILDKESLLEEYLNIFNAERKIQDSK